MRMCRRSYAGLRRTGKSCRLRWVNYLHPGLRRGRITADEERLILQLHEQWGSRWSRIARSLPGRTDNEIKNFWRTRARKQKAAAQQQGSRSSKTASAFSGSSSSSVTATTSRSSCSGSPSPSPSPSPSSGGCGGTATTSSSAVTESALRQSSGGDNDDEDAELDEASTTTAASQHQYHHQQQQQQQQQECYASADHFFWNDIAAAEAASYMFIDGWAGAGPGHPAAAEVGAEPPSSPTWEYCSDYSLWRIDDNEYYKKMLDSS